MTEDEFLSRLIPRENGCLEWSRSTAKGGYGKLKVGGVWLSAHRYAWMLKHGEIPPGMFVCHSCDNPPCCNVDHLWLGTAAENAEDMAVKKRSAVNKGMAKINIEIAREIRASVERGVDIARRFGVSEATVSQIRSNKVWRE